MLKIKNLHAGIEETKILKGINLEVNAGEIHAIMGPNGSGKSTLSAVIAGDENYEVDEGTISLYDEDLLELDPDERAHKGVFLSFQYPVEIPGISVSNFMKAAINEKRKNLGVEPISAKDLLHKMREKMELLNMKPGYLSRNMNEGFSGGEKKRNEILQMALLEPKIAILDETDSGLDIDALRIVASGIKKISNAQTGIILITHYQRLLDEIKPNYVHVMSDGQIIKTGASDLAQELEKKGYEWTDNFIKET